MTALQAARPPKAKRQKKEKPALEALPDDGHPGNSKFARALGSVDFQTREKGLQALRAWLVRKADVQEADMMKIWKGLFYCFWHSDKAPVQAELAERLAALLTQLSEESAYLYFGAFMTTMRREWFGIDRLRLDKFLMLIRKFIHRMLTRLKANKWRAGLVQRYADFLRTQVVLPGDTLPAAGVAYHCGDVLLDELRGVADGAAVPGEALVALLSPFGAALQQGEQAVLHRLGEGLFDTLLSELGNPTEGSPYLQCLDVAALAARLFEMGAEPNTRARNRQVLYDLSGALERLQRKRQRVEAGAHAGPSSEDGKPAGKAKKEKKKRQEQDQAQERKQDADQARDAVLASTNGDKPAVGAALGRPKRKHTEASLLHETASLEPDEGDTNAAAATGSKLKAEKRRKKKALRKAEVGADGAAALEDAATAPAQAAAVRLGAHGISAGHPREPTSGQKAALRAAVAKVILAAEAQTVAVKVGKPAPEAGSPAAMTPRSAKAKQAAEPDSDDSAAAPSTAGKPSALGKRSAPGAGEKAAPATGMKQRADAGPAGKTPVQALGGVTRAVRPAATTAKKSRVVINLKKNLYFEHGGPIPDPDVRTPPPARAKGGILKKTAKSCPPKMTNSGAAAKQHQHQPSGQQYARVVPKKAQRASAALFF